VLGNLTSATVGGGPWRRRHDASTPGPGAGSALRKLGRWCTLCPPFDLDQQEVCCEGDRSNGRVQILDNNLNYVRKIKYDPPQPDGWVAPIPAFGKRQDGKLVGQFGTAGRKAGQFGWVHALSCHTPSRPVHQVNIGALRRCVFRLTFAYLMIAAGRNLLVNSERSDSRVRCEA
jgi:hypothetical protein